ncbi:MAG: hypothetical protein ACLS48_11215 [[Eubacterium] siraeum]
MSLLPVLVNRPNIIIADEPTAALDSNGRRNNGGYEVAQFYRETIVIVTPTEQWQKCRRIVELSDGK